MSSNVKSSALSRKADSTFTSTVILWTMVAGLAVAGYLGLCIWFAQIREANGMATAIDSPFGELAQLDGGLPDWDALVSMADTGVFLIDWGFWILAAIAVLVAATIIKKSSFFQGFRNS